jgi:hypothetical protein
MFEENEFVILVLGVHAVEGLHVGRFEDWIVRVI